MADYYTFVSTDIILPAEVLDTFAKLAEYLEDEDEDRELDIKLNREDKEKLDAHDRGWCSLYFERESDDRIWIQDDCGSVYIDEIATCLHLALKYHDCDECVVFDWANGCSKHRIGAFGGGAVFIAKDRIDSITTYEWMSQRATEYELAQGPAGD